MLAGFVDGRGRAYDIGFRTLRLSLTDEEGVLALTAGEEVVAQGAATAAMEVLDPKPLPLLLPAPGEVVGTRRRAVFLATAGGPRPAALTFYNVSLSLHRTALEHFFTAQGGREFVQFEASDVEQSSPSGLALELLLHGPRPGAPKETSRFRLRIEPAAMAREALSALG